MALSTVLSIFANPTPSGKITTKGKDLYAGETKWYINATNLSYLACFPSPADRKRIADNLKQRGYNAARLHHVDGILRRGEKTVDELLAFVVELWAAGIRVWIDGKSDYSGYSKLSLFNGQNWADYKAYVKTLTPILQHPACFMFCAVNEGMTEAKNGSAIPKLPAFYAEMKAFVKAINPDILFTDGGDANIDPPLFVPHMGLLDIVPCHIYGSHPEQGFHIDTDWIKRAEFVNVSRWLSSLLPNTPVFFQERRCMPFDPNRGINEAFFASVVRSKYFCGQTSFQYGSNANHMKLPPVFTQTEDMAGVTDFQFMLSDLLCAAIAKYDKGVETLHEWGGLKSPAQSLPTYKRVTGEVNANLTAPKGTVIVKIAAKKRLVFLFDEVRIRGFSRQTTQYKGGTWQQVTSRGGTTEGFWESGPIDVGSPISGAYELNVWTLAQGPMLAKSGNTFTPSRSCGVFLVNLV